MNPLNKKHYYCRSLSRTFYYISACLVALFAGSHLIYETTRNAIPPSWLFFDFTPIPFNTALCFLISALALIAVKYNKSIARLLCSVTLLISLFMLFEHIFQICINSLFTEGTVLIHPLHQNHISTNTALCFVILSTTIFFYSQFRWRLSLSSTLIFISGLSLFSYTLPADNTYEWWHNLTYMPPQAKACFLLLGVSLLLSSTCDLKKYNQPLSSQFFAQLLFFILLAITCVCTQYVHEDNAEKNKKYFDNLVSAAESTVKDLLNVYEQNLRHSLGLFRTADHINKEKWQLIVQSINIEKNLPGIIGIGFIEYVREENMQSFIEQTRQDLSADFSPFPQTSYPDKFIIKYMEPSAKNENIIGFDIGSEANRRQSAEIARDWGVVTLTKKIEVTYGDNHSPGFLLLIPLYKTKTTPSDLEKRRSETLGWIVAPFIAQKFFGTINNIIQGQLYYRVYDNKDIKKGHLLYQNVSDETWNKEGLNANLLKKTHTATLSNQNTSWTIEWQASDSLALPASDGEAFFVLIIGLAFSLTLASIFHLIYQLYGAAAQKLQHEKKRNDYLIMRNPALIIGLTPLGIVRYVNPKVVTLTSYSQEELIGEDWWSLTSPGEDYKEEIKALMSYFELSVVR